MEKKTFVTLVMSVVGGMLFSLGMCMCLIPEWNAFDQGVTIGAVGAVELVITWLVYRKMAGKAPIRFDIKLAAKVIYGMFAALVFGAGMCMTMVLEGVMIQGIAVGVVGIVLLLGLIPMFVGFKNSEN